MEQAEELDLRSWYESWEMGAVASVADHGRGSGAGAAPCGGTRLRSRAKRSRLRRRQDAGCRLLRHSCRTCRRCRGTGRRRAIKSRPFRSTGANGSGTSSSRDGRDCLARQARRRRRRKSRSSRCAATRPATRDSTYMRVRSLAPQLGSLSLSTISGTSSNEKWNGLTL